MRVRAPTPPAARRLSSVDALRGLVMLLMTVDHARETFLLHAQVTDPMQLPGTGPALFYTRLSAHLCAPTFVALAGVSAWLYARSRRGPGGASLARFLTTRGLLLLLLEVSVVSFAWTGELAPYRVWLQVLWALGGSMLCLALASRWDRRVVGGLGLLIVAGHNLLTPITIGPDAPGHVIWTLLHDRGFLIAEGPLRLKVSYPILPWIGVMFVGYAAGAWFEQDVDPRRRRARLSCGAALALGAVAVLRSWDGYGEPSARLREVATLQGAMSFVNFTKYPPSLDFILMTLGVACALLVLLEAAPARALRGLVTFGGAPLFYYVAHLYVLLALELLALRAFGPTHGARFGVDGVAACWGIALGVAGALYIPCRWMRQQKSSSTRAWLRYL